MSTRLSRRVAKPEGKQVMFQKILSRLIMFAAGLAVMVSISVGPAHQAAADTPAPGPVITKMQDLTTSKKPISEKEERLYVLKEVSKMQARGDAVGVPRTVYNSRRSMFTIIAFTKLNCKGDRYEVKRGTFSHHGIHSVVQQRYKYMEMWYYGHKKYKAPLKSSVCRNFKKKFYGVPITYTATQGGGGGWSRPQMAVGPFTPPADLASAGVVEAPAFAQGAYRLAA